MTGIQHLIRCISISPVSIAKIKPHGQNHQHLMILQCKNNKGGRKLIILQGRLAGLKLKITSTKGPPCACCLLMCFLCRHIFHHVHCNARNVLALQISPASLPRVDLSLLVTFFLVSLAAREVAEWALLAATKRKRDRNTTTPIHHSGTNPAGAQTLRPIIQLSCCRASVGTSCIQGFFRNIDPLLCRGSSHI